MPDERELTGVIGVVLREPPEQPGAGDAGAERRIASLADRPREVRRGEPLGIREERSEVGRAA